LRPSSPSGSRSGSYICTVAKAVLRRVGKADRRRPCRVLLGRHHQLSALLSEAGMQVSGCFLAHQSSLLPHICFAFCIICNTVISILEFAYTIDCCQYVTYSFVRHVRRDPSLLKSASRPAESLCPLVSEKQAHATDNAGFEKPFRRSRTRFLVPHCHWWH
jgi:hypothetical protein